MADAAGTGRGPEFLGRKADLPKHEERAIDALRLSILLWCSIALGSCMGTSATPPSVGRAPVAVADAPLPRNVEPGQPLGPGLGAGRGIDPDAQLAASVRDRAAWAPIGGEPIVRSALAPGRNAVRARPDDGPSLNGMAGAQPAGDGTASPARGQDAALNRLEREGQRTAKPICTNC